MKPGPWKAMLLLQAAALAWNGGRPIGKIPLPNYRGKDDRSPERLAAAKAKRARKNIKRLRDAYPMLFGVGR